MLYIIEKDGLYFNSGSSQWVNSTGFCETPAWGSRSRAWGTTSKAHAEMVAGLYHGQVMEY